MGLGKELQTLRQQSQDLPTERCIKQKMTYQHVERLGSKGAQGENMAAEVTNILLCMFWSAYYTCIST